MYSGSEEGTLFLYNFLPYYYLDSSISSSSLVRTPIACIEYYIRYPYFVVCKSTSVLG
jgi:hypothetical protein